MLREYIYGLDFSLFDDEDKICILDTEQVARDECADDTYPDECVPAQVVVDESGMARAYLIGVEQDAVCEQHYAEIY